LKLIERAAANKHKAATQVAIIIQADRYWQSSSFIDARRALSSIDRMKDRRELTIMKKNFLDTYCEEVYKLYLVCLLL